MCRVYLSLSENAVVGLRIFYPACITSNTPVVFHTPQPPGLLYRAFALLPTMTSLQCITGLTDDVPMTKFVPTVAVKLISPPILSFIASTSIREL